MHIFFIEELKRKNSIGLELSAYEEIFEYASFLKDSTSFQLGLSNADKLFFDEQYSSLKTEIDNYENNVKFKVFKGKMGLLVRKRGLFPKYPIYAEAYEYANILINSKKFLLGISSEDKLFLNESHNHLKTNIDNYENKVKLKKMITLEKSKVKSLDNELKTHNSPLESIILELTEELKKKPFDLSGYIIQVAPGFPNNIYEIDTYGSRALLRTESVTYSSKGSFNLPVYKSGTLPIQVTGGFTQNWNVYVEVPKGYWKNVKELRKKRDTEKKIVKQLNQQIKKVNNTLANYKEKRINLKCDITVDG